MGKVSYEKTPGFPASIHLESQHCFSFRRSLMYAASFQRFAGAIVPNDIYYDHRYQVVNAYLPVAVDLSPCQKVGFSAKRDDASRPTTPDTLEVFLAITFFETIPDTQPRLIDGVPRSGDQERAHILFPGSWALLVWEKRLCLWHQRTQLLRSNPLYPNGVINVRHANLTDVFAPFLTR